jgi:multimeric flavodoxin WrbA
MGKVLAFKGSPRKNGNTASMLNHFIKGLGSSYTHSEVIDTSDLQIEYCRGCLRCNALGRCALKDDAWENISMKIQEADVLVFASPVYFHHVTASLKKVIDRFRSFIHVQITDNGLLHTTHQKWAKDFVLLLSMGSPVSSEALAVIDLFKFITETLGTENKLHVICGTRLAVSGQIERSYDNLKVLYGKMNLPENLAIEDYKKNQVILANCYMLGKILAEKSPV